MNHSVLSAIDVAPVNVPDSEIDVGVILTRLWKARKTIFAFTAATVLVATVLAFVLPPKYTSVASFFPPGTNTSTSGISSFSGQLSAVGAGTLFGPIKTPGEMYSGILKSRSISDKLIHRFDLMSEYRVRNETAAMKVLAANTDIDVNPKDSIITIRVTDRNPGRARDLTNGYLQALRDTNDRVALTEAAQRRVFFEQQLAKEKAALEEAEVVLKTAEEQSGLIWPSGQTAVQIQTIAQTRAEIALREVQLASVSQYATEQNPEAVSLRTQIGNLRSQLARLEGDTSQDKTLTVSKAPGLQLEFTRKERDLKYHETLFAMLAKQYEVARIDEANDAPMIQVLDSPSYPDVKSSPNRLLVILCGLIVGLVMGGGWTLARPQAQSFWAAISKET